MTANNIDLFEHIEELPEPVQDILSEFSEDDNADTYQKCSQLEAALKPFGYTFDWGLSGEPYDLRKIK